MICHRRSISLDNMCCHSVTPTGQCIVPLQPLADEVVTYDDLLDDHHNVMVEDQHRYQRYVDPADLAGITSDPRFSEAEKQAMLAEYDHLAYLSKPLIGW